MNRRPCRDAWSIRRRSASGPDVDRRHIALTRNTCAGPLPAPCSQAAAWTRPPPSARTAPSVSSRPCPATAGVDRPAGMRSRAGRASSPIQGDRRIVPVPASPSPGAMPSPRERPRSPAPTFKASEGLRSNTRKHQPNNSIAAFVSKAPARLFRRHDGFASISCTGGCGRRFSSRFQHTSMTLGGCAPGCMASDNLRKP